MKRKQFLTTCLALGFALGLQAQRRTVQNRPYTDLRPWYLGIAVGAHVQDVTLKNAGPQQLTAPDGTNIAADIAVDQDRWDAGFQVGVLGEARLSAHLQLRLTPTLYFGSRHLVFHNRMMPTPTGQPTAQQQTLKTVYVAAPVDLIFAASRLNNHRPYVLAGLAPALNLSGRGNDYVRLKPYDIFFAVGLGCDAYLPFFKVKPELKFMFSLLDVLDRQRGRTLEDHQMLPYVKSVRSARTQLFALTFYFE